MKVDWDRMECCEECGVIFDKDKCKRNDLGIHVCPACGEVQFLD